MVSSYVVLLSLVAGATTAFRIPADLENLPSTANCSENYTEQRLDHFSSSTAETYKQRYFTYGNYFKRGGPIFFYTGNEADVGLYVNATGLIWENAEEFGAYIVFAEHRYYGKSMPKQTITKIGSNPYPHQQPSMTALVIH